MRDDEEMPVRIWLPNGACRGLHAGLVMLALMHMLPLRTTHASITEPFHTRNQSPLVQIYGLPVTEGATIVPAHRLDIRLLNDFANNGTFATSSRERILLDGETQRITLLLRYGVPGDIEFGIDVAYVRHSGGIFDGLIDTWHETFGFAEGIRNDVERDQLLYSYVRNGRTKLELDHTTSGLGDIVLAFAVPVYRQHPDAARVLTLRTNLKLPTGEGDKLTGSGSTDIAVRLTASDEATLARANLALSASAGLLLLSKGDVLEDQQRHVVGFGSIGLSWLPVAWFAPKLQLDWHSPFYDDSHVPQLESWSAQFTIGGTFALPQEFILDIGVVEDAVVETAPDVVFHFGIRKRL